MDGVVVPRRRRVPLLLSRLQPLGQLVRKLEGSLQPLGRLQLRQVQQQMGGQTDPQEGSPHVLIWGHAPHYP